ncbi:MAG: hypothetical protein ACC657_10060 [Thiohalomonadales bacterium]
MLTHLYSIFRAVLLSVLVSSLVACSGDDNNPQTTNNPNTPNTQGSNTLPVASAGIDFETKENSEVVLDGAASKISEGSITRYEWTQIDNGSPTVTMTKALTPQVTFQAPEIDSDITLEFQLTVTGNNGKTHSDTISVIVFNTLPDWETHQANSSHTAYIPLTTHTKDFKKLWEWTLPGSSTSNFPYINPAVTFNGLLYISEDGWNSIQKLYAIDELSGEIKWQYDFGAIAKLNQPAVSNNVVSITTSGDKDTFIWNFNATTGELISKTPFSTQWPHYLSPTIFEGTAYINSGYYGGVISAYSTTDGALGWVSGSYGDNDMFTPAVDTNYIYQYSGTDLNVLNRTDGTLLFTILDPDPANIGYSHIGATVIGSMNNIISFSGDNSSGTAFSNAQGYYPRPLINFDLATKTVKWKSANSYLTHPATSKGKVYVATDSPLQLEVLDENDGSILWTWVSQNADITSYNRNIIVTDDLIFVSSDVAVHAISLDTKKEVWSYPEPGTLSISDNKILYITTGASMSDGKLVAISLKL